MRAGAGAVGVVVITVVTPGFFAARAGRTISRVLDRAAPIELFTFLHGGPFSLASVAAAEARPRLHVVSEFFGVVRTSLNAEPACVELTIAASVEPSEEPKSPLDFAPPKMPAPRSCTGRIHCSRREW